MHDIENYITPSSPRFLDALGHVVYDINDFQFAIANYANTHDSDSDPNYSEKVLMCTHQTLKKLSRMCMRSPREKLLAIYTQISVLATDCEKCGGYILETVLDCKSRIFETFNDYLH